MERILAAAAAAAVLAAAAPAANLPAPDDFATRYFGGEAARSVRAPAPARAKPVKPLPAPPRPGFDSSGRAEPDWSFTPGKLCTPSDPGFKEYRYPEHIAYCQRNVTQQMKQQVAAHYGVPQSDWGNYEFDHLIPLAIGGDSHVDNLWPQPHDPGSENGSEGKDKLEDELYKQMAAGTLTQAEAVKQIYDWFGRNYPAQAAIMAASK